MSEPSRKNVDRLTTRIGSEFLEYGINVVYLTLVFGSFTMFRRLVLATYDIAYTNYWIALIEALILGKVIMIGGLFHLGRGLEDKPLIYPALYKTFVYTVFIGLFKLAEHVIKALVAGKDLSSSLNDLRTIDVHGFLATALVLLVALIPFFALRELGRVYGPSNMMNLLFRRR